MDASLSGDVKDIKVETGRMFPFPGLNPSQILRSIRNNGIQLVLILESQQRSSSSCPG
jgi:hypothetical protein